jgi:hypothetical protein
MVVSPVLLLISNSKKEPAAVPTHEAELLLKVERHCKRWMRLCTDAAVRIAHWLQTCNSRSIKPGVSHTHHPA